MTIQLRSASYKGVSFLFKDLPTIGGNRLIVFRFPGSDKQAIERQGQTPREFKATIIIPHDDYYAQRDNLLRVLEDGQVGTLIHPTFGTVENVASGKYKLTEKLSEIGRAEINVDFFLDESPGIPQAAGTLPAQVQIQQEALDDQLETDTSDQFEVSLTSSSNFLDSIDNLNDVASDFLNITTLFDPLTGGAAELTKQVNDFSANTGSLITTPAELVSTMSELFESVQNLFERPEEVLGAMKTLFSFGDDDPVIIETTVGLTERKKNRDTIRTYMKTTSLGYAYTNASQSTYETDVALDELQNGLEAQYVDIRTNQNITNESLEQLDRLRVQAQKSLDEIRVNSPSIITVETPRRPLSVLLYAYYGNTDLFEQISDLNNINQNAFVEGQVRLLVV